MDYEGRLEFSLAGEFEEDAVRLQDALRDMGMAYRMAGDEANRQVLLILPLEATDGIDAMQQIIDLWGSVWEAAFEDLVPPERSAMRVEPGTVEVPDDEELEARDAATDPAPGSDDDWADVDAALEAEPHG